LFGIETENENKVLLFFGTKKTKDLLCNSEVFFRGGLRKRAIPEKITSKGGIPLTVQTFVRTKKIKQNSLAGEFL